MADGGLFVYSYARDAHEQITRLSDFISPTVVAMWNLRWQVKGFITENPDADQRLIVSRFASGSGVRGNEIKRACIDNSWDNQKSIFASILLTNTISIFEEFSERLVGLTLSGDAKRRAWKALQYPNSTGGRGYQAAYSALGNSVPELDGVFNDPNRRGRWYSGQSLQNLLLCYRFFKEMRNSLAHNGGRASAELIDAYTQFSQVATEAALNVREVPRHTQPVLGQKIEFDLRGINGFSNIVLKIIATYDADLSNREGAKKDIHNRLGKIKGSDRNTHAPEKREKRIRGLLMNSNLPHATLTENFLIFLKNTDRIPSCW